MVEEPEDWAAIAERLVAGDRIASLKVARLVAGFLTRWRAYDFRDEWPDLVQEVLIALVEAVKAGRLRDRRAVVGYIRMTAHHKFVDRLRIQLRHASSGLAWGELTGRLEFDSSDPEPEAITDVRRALDKLPEQKRKIVIGVYARGATYEQVSRETGIPLGTLKRHLREAIAELRGTLSGRPRGV